MRRGVTPAEGAWPRDIHGRDGGHIQEEIHSARPYPACGLFTGTLPPRPPGQPGSGS